MACWPTFTKRLNPECRPRHATGLPNELRTKLPNTRRPRIRYISEVAAADVSARVCELRMVENVEEFGANLEIHRFLHGNDLGYSEVGVVEARTVEESAIGCAEKSAVSTGQDPRHISALSSGK